jgi:hypothetical protein
MFLFAGGSKDFLPRPSVKKHFPWANATLAGLTRFSGINKLLGALGLVLPAVTGFFPWLTLAAASGLVLVMIGAAGFHAPRQEISSIGLNLVLLALALCVVIGRWVLAPF